MLDWIKSKTTKPRKDFGKFNFHVRSEPQFIDSSTTLTLTTYTNSSQTATIPCRYRWSIIKNGLTIEVPEFKGSSFKCEPADVGAVIQAEVINTDSEYGGTAVIHFGPVKLDVTLKKQIEIALSSGCTTMPVYLCSNGEEKECQVRLFEDLIKINHAYSQTNYTFDYSIFQPRVECVSKDSCRVVIVFSEKYETELRRFTKKLFDEQQQPIKDLNLSVKSTQSSNLQQSQPPASSNPNKLDIKFMNRNSRDIFLFTMKAFNTKKQLRSSVILTKIQKIDFTNQQTFDFILQIESLKSELVKMDSVIKKSYQEKLKYIDQVKRLEKEIEEIIITYTRIVEEKFAGNVELSRDYSMLSTKRDEIIAKKYKNLENENNHLNSRILTLTKEIDTIRFKPPTQTTIPPLQPSQAPTPHLSSMQPLQLNFNYQPSPFTKKRPTLLDESNNNVLGNILDQLGESRVSCISSVREDPELKMKLEQVEREREQLQKKLEMSFHRIDCLEKDLWVREQGQGRQQGQQGQQNGQQQKMLMNQSAIVFTYKGGVNDSMSNYTQPLNFSTVIDNKDRHHHQHLQQQNKQLKRSNDQLQTQRQKLIEQLKNSRRLSPQQKSIALKPSQPYQLDNSLNFLKTQKKDSSNLSQKQKDLIEALGRKDSQIKLMRMQNEELRKQVEKLRRSLQSSKSSQQHTQKLQRKLRQLQEQIEMYRKNSDALNRSQQLSMEMDNYNEEQINMLKQHNEFLTSENEKLSKACERYMTEAKEANKLRLEIIRLKERVNQLQKLNESSVLGVGVGGQ